MAKEVKKENSMEIAMKKNLKVQEELNNAEEELNVLLSRKAELNSAIKLAQKEISKRERMQMDSDEYKKHLSKLDSELVKVIQDIPKKETEIANLKRDIDIRFKEGQLKEYIEVQLRFYDNALKLLETGKGKNLGTRKKNGNHEASIQQMMRANGGR